MSGRQWSILLSRARYLLVWPHPPRPTLQRRNPPSNSGSAFLSRQTSDPHCPEGKSASAAMWYPQGLQKAYHGAARVSNEIARSRLLREDASLFLRRAMHRTGGRPRCVAYRTPRAASHPSYTTYSGFPSPPQDHARRESLQPSHLRFRSTRGTWPFSSTTHHRSTTPLLKGGHVTHAFRPACETRERMHRLHLTTMCT